MNSSTPVDIRDAVPLNVPPDTTLTRAAGVTVLPVLLGMSLSHMLNDTMQSLLPAIYPLLIPQFGLTFGQVGLLTFVFQFTASLLQPIVGIVTDKRPFPFALPVGMTFTFVGLLLLAAAGSYPMVIVAAAVIGIGSSIFHPEASRVARAASGGRHGFAQSLFQLGGNAGQSLGPLLGVIVLTHGQGTIAWFSGIALVTMGLLSAISLWHRRHVAQAKARRTSALAEVPKISAKTWAVVGVLMALMFSKNWYLASLTSYYPLYLIHKFGVSAQNADVFLFLFMGAAAVGTFAGGPIGDRFGRKYVIWFSILGVLPFTMILPYADLFWTGVLSVVIGLILSSAFAAIVVYAQELMPGRVGMVAGMFYGLSFGMGGIGAAILGHVADVTGIEFVYRLCAFLPAVGILAIFLPNVRKQRA